jgi:hypothetical protein
MDLTIFLPFSLLVLHRLYLETGAKNPKYGLGILQNKNVVENQILLNFGRKI